MYAPAGRDVPPGRRSVIGPNGTGVDAGRRNHAGVRGLGSQRWQTNRLVGHYAISACATLARNLDG